MPETAVLEVDWGVGGGGGAVMAFPLSKVPSGVSAVTVLPASIWMWVMVPLVGACRWTWVVSVSRETKVSPARTCSPGFLCHCWIVAEPGMDFGRWICTFSSLLAKIRASRATSQAGSCQFG